jgi:cytosine/adenosine deaminase-related metal-dependent hydrolase
VLAHAIHLSDRELGRLVETGSHVVHCPASNLFLASGVMPLGRYVEAGLSVGLGSDVAGGPDLSILTEMRVGFYAQNALRTAGSVEGRALGPLDWLRMGTLSGAQVLGLDAEIGSLETGKEADLIVIDPAFVATVPGAADADPEDLMSRLIFRSHPDMVRGAWVRGRQLEGPAPRA